METSLSEDTSLDRFRATIAEDGIAIPDVTAVFAYLQQHRGLEALVQPLCHDVRHEFGAGATLSLEVYCDPEIEDSYLVLYVRRPSYDASVMRRIEALRQAYADRLASAPGWFHVTTDFRPAR